MWRLLVPGLIAALLGAGCATADEAAAPSTSSQPASEGASEAAPVWETLAGPLARCGPQPPVAQSAAYRPLSIEDPQVGTIPAVGLGSGPTTLVFLHQTDGNGLCGWLPFLPVAAEAGYAALAVDLCRYGEAQCAAVDAGTFTDADQVDPVRVAVRYARRELGASTVVVVGASMGGSVALMSGVEVPGVAAVVDLSGPLDWPGVEVARGGRALPVPALVAMADTEGDDAVAGARTLAAAAPEGSDFLSAEAGHGWDLVTDPDGFATPLAQQVLACIAERVGPLSPQ